MSLSTPNIDDLLKWDTSIFIFLVQQCFLTSSSGPVSESLPPDSIRPVTMPDPPVCHSDLLCQFYPHFFLAIY